MPHHAHKITAGAEPIVIAGGGIVGLTLGLALQRSLGDAAAVTVCDPALERDPSDDLRASALAAGAQRMLRVLGVWDAVAGDAQPILDMVVTDSRLDDPIRPAFLAFAGEVEPGEPFAQMIENGPLTTALRRACEAAGVELAPLAVDRLNADNDRLSIRLSDSSERAVALLVGADGARSAIRELAGIGWVGWGYGQSGLVATLRHEREHGGRAYEHFLASGPFALLPLKGTRSSIVWTERTADAAALASLDADDLVAEIELRLGLELGAFELETPVKAYPMNFGIARRFVGDRLALVGEAAHVIHPLAGQGLNLGLRDAAALAEAVTGAARLGLSVGDASALAAYERARRFDTVAMGAATDVLNRLFSNNALPARLLRDLGLGLVERMPAAKRFFIREAAGLSGETPRLMRGEAL